MVWSSQEGAVSPADGMLDTTYGTCPPVCSVPINNKPLEVLWHLINSL